MGKIWNNRAAFDRWSTLTEWPMAGISLIFLGVYAYVVIGNLRITDTDWPEVTMNVIWVIFAVHYVVSLVLVPHTKQWFITHLHELAIVVLPFLRPLRLLRLVTLLHVLQRSAGAALRGKITLYVGFTSALLVLIAALAILDAEQNHPEANITSFGDATWWAVVTITTVGYGDHYPVTDLGRWIAVGLMIAGLGLIGSVTATLASWFVEKVRESAENAAEAETRESATEDDRERESAQLRGSGASG
ncbi:potassium channel family protein [Nesterenkonia flava]|uniref:Potassium channel family protein n=1 Tax=Nesterenkonia flava TaxID=469799 RepID=A0ABU1FUL6_9MICC|nr:potassium channel family protein [Nesterenkonia flava]MDR5712354.1 potassium channel family protein [Nesterenkonia flava]